MLTKAMTLITTLVIINALLQINQIENEAGYARIQIRETEIVNKTATILHIIHPKEIIYLIDKIENNIESNLDQFNIDGRNMLYGEIKTIRAKINTLIPVTSARKKRGLVNIVGTTYKWLFGLMDEDDREQILNHLEITDKNNHNIIKTVNKQIHINENFNETINILKKAIEDDRTKVLHAFNESRLTNNRIVKQMLFTDQMLKLKYLENKIEQLQDNIASAKYNILHPSILSAEEIKTFNIDFYKLKLVEMGLLTYKDDSLILAIKLPTSYIKGDVTLITPVPNKHFLEITEENKYVVNIDNKMYEYKEGVSFKNLKKTNICNLNTCKLRYNNKTIIENIGEETLIIKNAFDMKIKQNCDNRKIVIKGNVLINFYNCKIEICNETFYNTKTIVNEKYFYPETPSNELYFENQITFSDILINQEDNISKIDELKMHKNASYAINALIVILIGIIVIYIIYKRNKTKINDKIVNLELNIQPASTETVETRGGGVIYGPLETPP